MQLGPALTWDELGDLYGSGARRLPPETVYEWAAKQKDRFAVDAEGSIHVILGDSSESTGNSDLFNLVCTLLIAKEAENKAKEQRIRIEEEIAALIPGPDSGQKTVKLDDGTSITVKRGWNYRANCPALLDLACKLELEHVPVKQKTTHELDEKGYEWYRSNDKEVFDKLAGLVVVTPKKVAVEIKRK